MREYWTLERRGEHWVLESIESGAEGEHALDDKIVQKVKTRVLEGMGLIVLILIGIPSARLKSFSPEALFAARQVDSESAAKSIPSWKYTPSCTHVK